MLACHFLMIPRTSSGAPLVTIGIPTFNRSEMLRRAVGSVQSQTYGSLEILISDNGSTDETAEICRDAARRDRRIALTIHAQNVGALANFESLVCRARGEYFMWLADDDWIDNDYVEKCLGLLTTDSRLSLVCGHVVFHSGDGSTTSRPPANIVQDSAAKRVAAYLEWVTDNSPFYGLARLEDLKRTLPLNNRLGEDWRVVADLAMVGGVSSTSETVLHRSAGGASADMRTLKAAARQMGAGALERKLPFTVVASYLTAHLFRATSRRGLPFIQRLILSVRCFGVIWCRWSLRPFLHRVRHAASHRNLR